MPNRYEAVMNKRSVRIIQTLRGELAKPVVQNGMNAAGRNGGTVLQSGLIRNYFDSAGITPATVDNPVGLTLDAVGTVGPNLVTNGDFANGVDGWTVPAGWGLASGAMVATATSSSMVQQAAVSIPGSSYEVEFDWTHTGGTLYVRVGAGTAATFATSGRKRVTLVAVSTAGIEFYGGSVSGELDNIVSRRLTGNHATQPTTGSKPTLRLDANGRYYWQFDPAAPGDFLQTSITTGNEGWVCAGVNFTDANVTFFSSGTTAANAGIWLSRNVGGAKSMNLAVANGSAIAYSPNIIPPANTSVVVSGGWTAATVFAGVDNTETATTARSGASASTLPLRIGMATDGSYMLSGGISATVICPTLPPPADRALIRKWVGSLQGQTL